MASGRRAETTPLGAVVGEGEGAGGHSLSTSVEDARAEAAAAAWSSNREAERALQEIDDDDIDIEIRPIAQKNDPRQPLTFGIWCCFRRVLWPSLSSFTEIPEWLQYDKYKLRYYRRPVASAKYCLQSIFFMHNETGNIWTHLAGAIMFALAFPLIVSGLVPYDDVPDRATFVVWLMSVIICLTLSTVYHTFSCHSHKINTATCQLDYFGIAMLILGSFASAVYFLFFCSRITKIAYWSAMGAGTLGVLIASFNKTWQNSRRLKAATFVAFASFGVIPVVHDAIIMKLHFTHGFRIFLYMEAVAYLLGVLVYATEFPEKKWPTGRFDLFLHSHQIFHVFVLIGAMLHFIAMVHAYLYRESHPCT